MIDSPRTAKAKTPLTSGPHARAQQVRMPRPGANKPRRAVLFGYLLRSAAQSRDAALSERAALVVDRLELNSLESLIPLLDAEELRLMAALALAPQRQARMRGLTPKSMVVLVAAADFEVAIAFLKGLDVDGQKAMMAQLGTRRSAFEVALGLRRPAKDKGVRLFDALRLRRLFMR